MIRTTKDATQFCCYIDKEIKEDLRKLTNTYNFQSMAATVEFLVCQAMKQEGLSSEALAELEFLTAKHKREMEKIEKEKDDMLKREKENEKNINEHYERIIRLLIDKLNEGKHTNEEIEKFAKVNNNIYLNNKYTVNELMTEANKRIAESKERLRLLKEKYEKDNTN